MSGIMLDVGCAGRPRGDVNVDLFLEPRRCRYKGRIIPQKVENFVLADALRLPFRDDCFDEVFSGHTIEHMDDPNLFLKELIRVSKKIVTITCPHRLGEALGIRSKYHRYSFNVSWFRRTLRGYPHEIYVRYEGFPRVIPYLSLFQLPAEIKVDISKKPWRYPKIR
jgi:ubiquinone/menaquinone biosynthesis C-methylase UbiE